MLSVAFLLFRLRTYTTRYAIKHLTKKTRQDYKSYLKQDDELKRAARGNNGRCEAFARFAFYKTSESQEVNKEREMFDQV